MKIRQYLYIQVPKTFLDHCLLHSDLDIKLTLRHFYLEQESPNFTARSVSTLQQLTTALLQIFLRTNTKNKTKVDVVCNRRFIQQKSVPRVALLSFVGMEFYRRRGRVTYLLFPSDELQRKSTNCIY
jgi:hypothetical protein